MCCPHYDSERGRIPALKRMVKRSGITAIALDQCAAIEVADEKYKIIISRKDAKAFRLFVSGNRIVEEELVSDGKFRPLSDL
jgi:hypothetical protein